MLRAQFNNQEKYKEQVSYGECLFFTAAPKHNWILFIIAHLIYTCVTEYVGFDA